LIVSQADAANTLDATIKALLFVGDKYECVLQIGSQEVRSFLPRPSDRAVYEQGARVRLTLPANEVVIWPR
jgi:hypothetical protein